MSISSAIAQQQNARPSIATLIAQLQPEIARALPKGMDADRIARLALTALRKTPKLAECSPESFAGALLTASALGLEPNVGGEAWLVPYKRECTLIVGYVGLAKLYFQHPLAQHLDAQAVYEADAFDYAYGLDPFLIHKPAKGERGQVTAYYAVARLTTGAKAFVVLSPEEVKTLRNGKVGPNGDIPDPQHWMERKTAVRQLVKLLPKSTTLIRALAADEHSGRELQADLVAARQIEAPPANAPAVAQPVTSTPETASPAPGVEAINEQQWIRLRGLLREAGMDDQVASLAYLSDQVNRPLAGGHELSKTEAAMCIERLEKIVEAPFEEPPEYQR
jgi:recombination protein RecT